ncbi:hypothetical protein [Aliifodinibius sp. S!AR15-10]|uniref:hypothetical protein n=1 Tax=Aliifodinibius sp. S!AR15-10 TaxID=2950437 RepID=UPI0038F7424F
MIWDNMLGLNVLLDEINQTEVEYYPAQQNGTTPLSHLNEYCLGRPRNWTWLHEISLR